MKQKTRYNILPNGDVEGIITYPENKVTIQLEGREVEIGVAPEYDVVQVIKKDKIPQLLRYLNEQLDYVKQRIKASDEVIDKTEHIDIDKLAGSLDKLPLESPTMKKYKKLNQLAEDFYMKSSAVKNKALLVENLEKIDEQIQFLSKLV